MTSYNWNDKCFITCSDECEPAAELIDGIRMDPDGVIPSERDTILRVPTGHGICGIDWTSGIEWADDIGESLSLLVLSITNRR